MGPIKLDTQKIIANLEKLLEQGKESALLRFSLGNEYLKLEQTWVAIFHFKRALELDPKYSAAWKMLGTALEKGDNPHEALQTFRRGIEIAQQRGDQQAAKEMTVFARRIEKKLAS